MLGSRPPILTPAANPLKPVYECTYNGLFAGFEWDVQKARANLRKHGVDFADAVAVFEDDLALTMADEIRQSMSNAS